MNKFFVIIVLVVVSALCGVGGTVSLESAVRWGSPEGVERVKTMLATGEYDDHLNGALQNAAHSSTLEMVKVLVEAGADVNPKNGGETPLHKVAANDERDILEIAKYLVSKGAEIDAKNSYGGTPLYIASDNNRASDFAVWLLEQGADPNVQVKADERTPLLKAASKVQERTIVKLVEKGADVNVRGHDNNTPLHYASYGIVEAAKSLIEAGADINALNDRGETPLHITARFLPFGLSYQADIAKLLLKAGADPYIKNKRGKTVFDVFEKWLKKWQGDTFNVWGGQKFTDEQFECLKTWRREMPKLLERAKKKHNNELNIEAETVGSGDKNINITRTVNTNVQSGGNHQEQEAAKHPSATTDSRIFLLIVGVCILIIAVVGTVGYVKKRK